MRQRAGVDAATFMLSFLAVLGVWIAINITVLVHHWDPYPFILLNLVLSCLAAIQAPIIMMSQQRQATRDRLQAESDYQVNVKAEILLEHLTKEIEEIKLIVGPAPLARDPMERQGAGLE